MTVAREIALGIAAAILFGGSIVTALAWSPETAMFPMVIGIAGLGLAIWAIATDIIRLRSAPPEPAPMSAEDSARARGSFAWIGAFFAAVLLVGFQWGLPLAALAYYRIEAGTGWTATLITAAICGGFLYGAENILHIPLYAGALMALIP
jgi:hypothetical protein